MIVHIDQGFDFLGMRIQRHRQRGSKQALRLHLPVPSRPPGGQGEGARHHPRVNEPVALRPLAPAQPGAARMDQLPPPRGVSKDLLLPVAFTWRRVWSWLRHKHPKATVKQLRRRYLRGWWPEQDEVTLFNPARLRSSAIATGER